MHVSDLKPGDIVECNYGAWYPTEEFKILSLQCTQWGVKALAYSLDEDNFGKSHVIQGHSAPVDTQQAGWRLVVESTEE